jgi:uncharacterized protein YccT (UPF0319 family)
MFRNEDLIKICSDSELKMLALIFSSVESLRAKGLLTMKEIDMLSMVGAKLGQDLLHEKKKDWEK